MPTFISAHKMQEMTNPFAEKALIADEERKQKERNKVEFQISQALPGAKIIVANNEIFKRASLLFEEYLSAEALLEEYLKCRPHEVRNVFGNNNPVDVIAVCQLIEEQKRIDSQKK